MAIYAIKEGVGPRDRSGLCRTRGRPARTARSWVDARITRDIRSAGLSAEALGMGQATDLIGRSGRI